MHTNQRPSDLTAAQGIYPHTSSLVEFELAARHQIVYPKSEPLDAARLAAFIASTPFGGTNINASSGTSQQPEVGNTSACPLATVGKVPHRTYSDDINDGTSSVINSLGPPKPGAYCDSRLNVLKIGFWTRVAIPNELAASAISFYLVYEHPLFTVFDADLVLTDLVKHRLRFCSAFFVSSLLYLSCQAYARIDRRSLGFVPEFRREASTLWRAERNSRFTSTSVATKDFPDAIMVLAAAELMCLGCELDGQDEMGREFLEAGRKLATELGLIDAAVGSSQLQKVHEMTPEWKKMAAHVAWGTYNWTSVFSFFFFGPPILYPPSLSVPGEHEVNVDEIGSSKEPDIDTLPAYTGQTFPTMCRFWEIFQEIAVVYLGLHDRPLSQRVPLAFAEAKYQKLLTWADTMLEGATRGHYTPAHVSIFHMIFHSMVIQMFHPFLQASTDLGSHKMRSFSSTDSTPAAVIAASLNQLSRQLFQYQQRTHPATFSIFLNIALVQLGDAMLNRRLCKFPNRRLCFLLCMYGWLSLYESYNLFWDVTKGFLARALSERLLSSAEAKAYMKDLLRCGVHHKVPQHTVSSMIIDFNLAEEDPDLARIKVIAEMFDDLALHAEFTTNTFEWEG
ncbi:nitrate assimilation regulatory protein nirA [Pochonia chlamydosporia 170]|uniref:Nitrate assimilation regulatory protein nirA n=1 Tax=Pochonia chlamydosporia 170 TaxID=1380566 RepID=A0A179FHM6_METCM|nr:nitrate assimilation regulatory protein nirA [Pochonia chlamydosporia 170]OAQ65032.1 nitrate assimilation regulatory protein nirA [Pochonia chlamydosporia 170]